MLTSNIFPKLADSILTSVSKGYFLCAELLFESVESGRAKLNNSPSFACQIKCFGQTLKHVSLLSLFC